MVSETFEFTRLTCPECTIPFFVTQTFFDLRLQDEKAFHCPNGHALAYPLKRHPEFIKKDEEIKSLKLKMSSLQEQLELAQERQADKSKETASKETIVAAQISIPTI